MQQNKGDKHMSTEIVFENGFVYQLIKWPNGSSIKQLIGAGLQSTFTIETVRIERFEINGYVLKEEFPIPNIDVDGEARVDQNYIESRLDYWKSEGSAA